MCDSKGQPLKHRFWGNEKWKKEGRSALCHLDVKGEVNGEISLFWRQNKIRGSITTAPPPKQTNNQTNPLKYLDFAVLTEEGTSNRDLIQHSTPEKWTRWKLTGSHRVIARYKKRNFITYQTKKSHTTLEKQPGNRRKL